MVLSGVLIWFGFIKWKTAYYWYDHLALRWICACDNLSGELRI